MVVVIVIKSLLFLIVLCAEAKLIMVNNILTENIGVLITFISSIIAYLGYDIYSNLTKIKNKVSLKDVELFEKTIGLISGSIIRFFKEQDFLSSFDNDNVTPLYEFVYVWNDIEHEFMDKKLESKKIELYEKAKHLSSLIANKTVPIHSGRHSVKSDSIPIGPTPDYIKKDAETINLAADEFIAKYNEFVKISRMKLYQ